MNISEITYQGNKTRLMKVLKPLIEDNLEEGMVYIEPFGGGMNSFTPINSPKKIANDVNEYNIALWLELKAKGIDGVESDWRPFLEVLSNCEDKPKGENFLKAKALYLDMKLDCLSNGGKYPKALLGFVAYACSFGGGWWNGFAGYNEKRGENYIKEAISALKKQVSSTVNIENSDFRHGSYDSIDIPDNAFVYCDPPYAETKKYANSFDNEKFWEWCRNIIKTKENVKILISEYNAPSDFICIWSRQVQDKMGKNTMSKNEKLFIHNSQTSKFDLSSLSEVVKVNHSDIKEMVKKTINKIISENIQNELMAYHGTPASFDNFDMNFMGTGEGTQVYGYGLYFTDVYDTGEWYAISIAYTKGTKDKTIKKSETKTILTYISSILNNLKGWEKGKMTMDEFKRRVELQYEKLTTKNSRTDSARDLLLSCNTIQEVQEKISSLKREITSGMNRYVYKVDIPDGPYIDWTNSDPSFIKDMYQKFSERFDLSHVDIKRIKTFGELFEKIRGWRSLKDYQANGETISQKEMCKMLYNLGYKGIQVRTGHRNGGDGRGMNFIVFNDKDVKITEKKNI